MFNPVYETTLLFIEWQVLRSGRLKPVAHFIPFKHERKTYSSAPVGIEFIQTIPPGAENPLVQVQLNPNPAISSFRFPLLPGEGQGEVVQFAIQDSRFKIPVTCPFCGSPIKPFNSASPLLPGEGRVRSSKGQGEVVSLFCSRPDICPAQSGNLETVQRANPHLRVAFPFYTSWKARFVHACNAFGCIPVPIKEKESCYDFMVLAPDEQTYGKIGYYMGVTQWSITQPERIPIPDLIKQIQKDNPILKYY
jgi:hypothetical protein